MKVDNLRYKGTRLKKRQISFKTELNLPKYGKIEGFEVDEVIFSLLDGLVDDNEKIRDTIVKTLMKFANYQPDFILKSILTFLQVQKTSINHQYSLLTVVKKCILELKNIPNSIIKEILLFMLKELSFLKPSDPRHVEMREIVNTATVLCPSFSVDVILTLIKDINQSEDYYEILCIYVRILTHLCTVVPKNSYVKSILISSHIMNLYNKEVFKEQNGDICKEMSSLLYAISNMLLIKTYVNSYYGTNMPLYSLYSASVLVSSNRNEEETRNHEEYSGLYESLDLENNTYREFDGSYRNSNSNLNSSLSRNPKVLDLISTTVSSSRKTKKINRPNIENIKNILEPLYGLMLDYYIPKIYINPMYNNTCLELLYSLVVISEYVSTECFRTNSMNLLTCIIVRFLNYVPNLQLNDNLWFKLHKINSNNLTNKFVSLFSNPNALGEMPPKFFIGGLRIYLQVLNNYDRYPIYTNSYKSRLLSNGNYGKNGINNDFMSDKEDECDGFYVDNIIGCLKIIFGVGPSGLMLVEFLYNKLTSGIKADLVMSLYIYILLLSSNKHFLFTTSSSSSMSSNRSDSNYNEYNIILFKVIDNINNIFNQNINDNYSLYILIQFVNMLLVNNYILFYVSYNSSRQSSVVSLSDDTSSSRSFVDHNQHNNNDTNNEYVNDKQYNLDYSSRELMKKRNKMVYYIMNYIFEYKIKIDINKRVDRNYKLYNNYGKKNLDIEFFLTLYQNNTNVSNKNDNTGTKFFIKNELVGDEENMFEECVGNFIKFSGEQFLHYLMSKLMNNVKRNSLSVLRYLYRLFELYKVDLVKRVLDEDELINLLVIVLIYVHDPIYYFGEAYYSSKLLFMLYSVNFSKENLTHFGTGNFDSGQLLKDSGVVLSNLTNYSKLDCFYVNPKIYLRKGNDTQIRIMGQEKQPQIDRGSKNDTRVDNSNNSNKDYKRRNNNKDVNKTNTNNTNTNKDNIKTKELTTEEEDEQEETPGLKEYNNKNSNNEYINDKQYNEHKQIRRDDKKLSFLNTNDIIANFTNVSRLVRYLNRLYKVDGSKVVKSVRVLIKKLKNKPLLTRTSSFSFSAPSFLNTSSSLFGNSSSLFGGSGNTNPLKINDIVIDTDLTVIQNFGVLNVICMFMNHNNSSNVINTILSTTSSGGAGFKEEVSVDLVSEKGDIVIKDGEEDNLFWDNSSDIKYTLLSLSSICISNLSNEENYKNLVLKLDYLMIMNPLKDTAFSLFGKTSSYLQSERTRLMIISALTHIYVQVGRYFVGKDSNNDTRVDNSSNTNNSSNQNQYTNQDYKNKNKKLGREEVMKMLNDKFNEIVNKMNLKRDQVLLVEKEKEEKKEIVNNKDSNTKDNSNKENRKTKESQEENETTEKDMLSRYIIGPLINMFNNESDASVQEYLLSNLLLITVHSSRQSSVVSLSDDMSSSGSFVDHNQNNNLEMISLIFSKLIGIMMKLINESYKLNEKNIKERFENHEILNVTRVERDVGEKEQSLPFYCFMLLSSFSPHFRMFRDTDFPYLVLYYILYYSDYYTYVKVAKFDLLFSLNYNYHKTLKVSRCVHYYLTNLYLNLCSFDQNQDNINNINGIKENNNNLLDETKETDELNKPNQLEKTEILHNNSINNKVENKDKNYSTNKTNYCETTAKDINKINWSVLYNMVITVLNDNNNVENLLVRNRLYILVQFLDSVMNDNSLESTKSVIFELETEILDNKVENNDENYSTNKTKEITTEEDEDNWVKILILVWSYILKISDNNIKLLLINVLYKLLNLYYYEFGNDRPKMEVYIDNKEDKKQNNKTNSNRHNIYGNFSFYYENNKDIKSNNISLRLDKISKLNSIDNINKLIPEKLTLKFMLFSMNYLENSSYISNSLVKILHRILQTSMNRIPVTQLQSSLIVIFKRFQQYFQNNNLPLFLRSFLVDVFKYNINILFNILFNYNIKFQSTVIFIIIKNDYLLHLLIKYLHRYIDNQLNLCFCQTKGYSRSISVDSKDSDSSGNLENTAELTKQYSSGNTNSSNTGINAAEKENKENKKNNNRNELNKTEILDNNSIDNKVESKDENYSTEMLDKESKEVVLDYLLEYNMNVFNNNNRLVGCYSDYVNSLIMYVNIVSYFDKVTLMGNGGVKDSEVSSKDAIENRKNKMVRLLQMMNYSPFVDQDNVNNINGRENNNKDTSNNTDSNDNSNKKNGKKNISNKGKNNRDMILYYSVNIIGKNKQILKSFLSYTYNVVSSFDFSSGGTEDKDNTNSNNTGINADGKENKNNNNRNENDLENRQLLLKGREELLREVLMRMLIDLIKYKLIVGYDSKILKIMKFVNKDNNKIKYELVHYYLKNMYNSQLNPYYNIFGVKYTVVKRKRKQFMKELMSSLVYGIENGDLIDSESVYYYMKVISRVLEVVAKGIEINGKNNKTNKFKRYEQNPYKIISFVVKNKTFFVNKKLRYSYLMMYCSIIKYLKISYGNINRLENLRTYLLFPTSVAILSKDTKSLAKVSNRYLKLFVSLFFGNCFNVENVNLYEEIITGLMVKGNVKNKCLCNCNNTSNSSSGNEEGNEETQEKNTNNSRNLCISNTFQLLYLLSYFLPDSNLSVNKDIGERSTEHKENNDEYVSVPANISEEFKTIKKSQLDQKSSKVLFRNSSMDEVDSQDSDDEEFVDINYYYDLKLKVDGTTSCTLSRSSSYSILNKEPVLRPSFHINKNSSQLVELENMSVSPDSLLLLVLCDYSVKEGSPKSNFKYSSDSLEEYLAMNKNAKNLSLLRLKNISSISNSFLFLSSNIYRFITMQKYLQQDLIPINIFTSQTKLLSSYLNFGSNSTSIDPGSVSNSLIGYFSFNPNFYSPANNIRGSNSSDTNTTETETIEDAFISNSIKLCIFIMTKSSLYISNSNSNSNNILESHNPTKDQSPRGYFSKAFNLYENDKSALVIRKNHLAHFESLCNVVISKLCKLIESNKFKLYTYKQLQHLSNIIPH